MVRVIETTKIAQITGADSINNTHERFGIVATDLGLMWDAGPGDDGQDRVFVMFGDTYGEGWGGFGAGPSNAEWRNNVLLASTTKDLDQGMFLDSAVTKVRQRTAQLAGRELRFGSTRVPVGAATQVIRRNRLNVPKANFPEHTLIPNAGITVDGVHYVHWMSVLRWGAGGRWRTFQAGSAKSTDDGRTWEKPVRGRWLNLTGKNRFQIGAFTRDDEWVYLFGTTNGRYGPAYLARVAPSRVAEVAAYEYWDGAGWQGSQRAAAPVMPGPVGELSVVWHEGLGKWLTMYLDETKAAIVVRSADSITGPWSEDSVVVAGTEYPGLYGGFMHPWQLDGNHVYWLMSQWAPYNVFLMRTELAQG